MEDLNSSYIDEVDNSIEFEIVEDSVEESEEEIDQAGVGDSIYAGLDLPDPDDNRHGIFTCSGCYARMDKVMMLITNAGVCDHYFCTSCIARFQEAAGSENFICPCCGKQVITVAENRYAVELANVLESNQITPSQLEQLEQQNIQLEQELAKQREEFQHLQNLRVQEKNQLSKSLDNARKQKEELASKVEQVLASHESYKQRSESLIRDLEQKIESTKVTSTKQLQELQQERERLIVMQQNEKQQAEGAVSTLEQKILDMEKKLKVNNRLQQNLEQLCQKTVKELHEREGEVTNVRAQMKRELLQRSRSQNDSMLDTLSKSMSGLLWTSEARDNRVDLVKNLETFEMREIRGNRKDGRVRKALLRGGNTTVALKKVSFDASVLPEQSVLATIGSFWYSKTDKDLESERIRKHEVQIQAFREAMLLCKLSSEYLLPLQGIVQSPTRGEFYLELPFIEFDLDYAVESRGNKLNDKVVRMIAYQLLLGVYYLHSGNIVHRHLSPATILTNDMQKIYIAGMSFAISIETPPPFPAVPSQHLDCVAPELLYMSSDKQPSHAWKAIDMWAVGTIISFLLTKQPLFRGTQKTDVLQSILSIKECAPAPGDENVAKFSIKMPTGKQKSFSEIFPANCSTSGVDLCSRLLQFDPKKRIGAEEALQHPYFFSLSSKNVPCACTVGYECTDEDIPVFVESYCSSVFS